MAKITPLDAVKAVQPARPRIYRLIDACFEPHHHLDDCYPSHDDAIAEAVNWLQARACDAQQLAIGVEVCMANGDWRTYRLPTALLCRLP